MISPQSLKKSYQTKKRDKYVEEKNNKEILLFFDYESDEQTHVNAFMSAMDNMKKAEKIGKQITYKSGYSNFTFDLWIVLHMADSNASYAHRKQYLVPINRAFGEKFASMEEYKEEENFKHCLKQMDIRFTNIKDITSIKKIHL